MSPRIMIIGLLALTFGGSAAVGVNILYRQKDSTALSDAVQVVVANADIARGARVTSEQLSLREFPRDGVPPGALTKIADAVDRVAYSSVVKDEPLLDRKFSPRSSKGGLAPLVPKGMRAFTIQTSHVAGQLAGFLLPGNHVDVLLTMGAIGPNDPSGGGTTTTLLQNVEILAVDQRLDAPTENKMDTKSLQSVTLLVTPDQAAKLDLGQNKGTLHLALRNPDDDLATKTGPATLSGLQLRADKSWLGQIAQLVDGLRKAKPGRKTATPARVAVAEPFLEIRTLRGIHSGMVRMEPIPDSPREP